MQNKYDLKYSVAGFEDSEVNCLNCFRNISLYSNGFESLKNLSIFVF